MEEYQSCQESQHYLDPNPRFNPQAAISREVHIYDEMIELSGESLFERRDGGGKRGRVLVLSAGARRRLRKACARVPRGKVANFFTATYANPKDAEQAKRHLDNFGKRMRYHYKDCFMVWRVEVQGERFERTGDAVAHYHFLVYGGPQIVNKKGANKEVFEFMRKLWNEVTGQDGNEASTRYERLKSMRGVHRYISKYLGKEAEGPSVAGRQWGIIGRAAYKAAVDGGKRIWEVTAERWHEIKKGFQEMLHERTGNERWLWGPWWHQMSVYMSREEFQKRCGVLLPQRGACASTVSRN